MKVKPAGARWLWPTLLLAFAPLTWGGNLVVGRALAGAVDPTTLNVCRWGGAALLLTFMCGGAFWRHRRELWSHRRLVLALGLTGIGGFHLLQYTALAQTTVLNVALLSTLTPLYVVVIAWAMSGDRIRPRQALGVGLSIVGAAVVVTRGDIATVLRLDLNGGDLIQVVAVGFWALYTVLLRFRPTTVPPLPFLLATVLPGLALSLATYALRDFQLDLSPEVGLGLAYLVVFPSTLAYIAFGAAVRELGPQMGGAATNLIPLSAAVLAVALLGEPLRPYHLTSAVLVGLGLWCVSRR